MKDKCRNWIKSQTEMQENLKSKIKVMLIAISLTIYKAHSLTFSACFIQVGGHTESGAFSWKLKAGYKPGMRC